MTKSDNSEEKNRNNIFGFQHTALNSHIIYYQKAQLITLDIQNFVYLGQK